MVFLLLLLLQMSREGSSLLGGEETVSVLVSFAALQFRDESATEKRHRRQRQRDR